MSRAETLTKLPLDRWAQIIGLNPLHFNGVYWPDNPPTVCQQPWMQRADQAVDRVGREEIAQAIAQAESDIERELGYRLIPSWEVDEWQGTERPNRPELFNISVSDIRGMSQTAFARWGWLVSGGIRSKTLIDDDAAVVYDDFDVDGYAERATVIVTMPATGMSACEVRVFIPGNDTYDGIDADDRYEIKPVTVTISGLTATIRFRREQALKPSVYNDSVPAVGDSHLRGADGSVNANFLTLVDVYRVYNDPQTQITFLWEPFAGICESCTSGCAMCAYTAQTGCLMARDDPRLSILSYHPADWDSVNLTFTASPYSLARQPDLVRLFYYAGYRDKSLSCPTTRMAPEWERVVAYYAASLLDRPICECNNVHAFVEHWQCPPDKREMPQLMDNPFGVSRGAMFAWRRVLMQGNAIGRPVLA